MCTVVPAECPVPRTIEGSRPRSFFRRCRASSAWSRVIVTSTMPCVAVPSVHSCSPLSEQRIVHAARCYADVIDSEERPLTRGVKGNVGDQAVHRLVEDAPDASGAQRSFEFFPEGKPGGPVPERDQPAAPGCRDPEDEWQHVRVVAPHRHRLPAPAHALDRAADLGEAQPRAVDAGRSGERDAADPGVDGADVCPDRIIVGRIGKCECPAPRLLTGRG